ncbi:MAG: hypothetical protein ACRDCW_06900 [Sarcina sp.]
MNNKKNIGLFIIILTLLQIPIIHSFALLVMKIDHLVGESFTTNTLDYVPMTTFIIIPICLIIGINYFIKGIFYNKNEK